MEEAVDYTGILPEIKIPILVLHGKRDEDIPKRIAREAFQKIGAQEKKMMIIREANHHFEGYLNRRKLIALSINWFKKFL